MTTVFDTKKQNFDWKGSTLQQVASGVKFNAYTPNTLNSLRQIMRSRPLKIYRKEIASKDTNCNPRISLKIDKINQPGGSIITNNSNNKGLVNTLDINYENNSCQHPSSSYQHCTAEFSVEKNALRRVRSSGMTHKKYTINSRDNYFSSTQQYLNNRNISYKSNEYFNIRKGDSTATPGTLKSAENVYTSNGINHCPKFKVIQELTFTYWWIDGSPYIVTVPVGEYDVSDLNNTLHNAMYNNQHYFLEMPQKSRIFLMSFLYDSNTHKISLKFKTASSNIFTPETYPFSILPLSWTSFLTASEQNICFDISTSPVLADAIGFAAQTYPNPRSNTGYTNNQMIEGIKESKIISNFLPIYYKPNNSQFATQGAVSSSDLIVRKKYDTITTAGASFRSSFGNQTANALAYGVPSNGYTIKDKVGFPLKCTPTFSKYNNIMKRCSIKKIVNAI